MARAAKSGGSPLLVTISTATGERKAGMGFLISQRHVLTCAHVIYDGGWVAIGSPEVWDRLINVSIEGDARSLMARIAFLSRPDSALPAVEDICVLELDPVPAFDPERYPLVVQDDFTEIKVRTLGVPLGAQQSGTPLIARTENRDLQGRVFLSTEGETQEVLPGFSGAPVIRVDRNDVLGMLVARQRSTQRAFMLPIDLIDSLIREARDRESKAPIHIPLIHECERANPHVSELKKYASDFLSEYIRGVAVPTQLAFCGTYEQVTEIHRGAPAADPVGPRELLERGPSIRIYIQAPGGSGKTAYLMRFMQEAIARGWVPFYLDAKNAGKLPEGSEAALDLLFRQCTQGGGRYDEFKRLGSVPGVRRVLIVDGLNESLESKQRVRELLDEVSRNSVSLGMVVADRLTGASASPGRFQRATILPIDLDASAKRIDEIAAVLTRVTSDKFRKLLTIPFFLDMYLDLSQKAASRKALNRAAGRAGILELFFERTLRKAESSMTALARVAFDAYATPERGLRIGRAELERNLQDGAGVVAALLAADVLIEDKSDVFFRHQLLHDFLVAKHLKELGPRKWRGRIFDVATFNATSFEAMEFTSELLRDRADEFIAEVYDWNYTAALDCVLNLEAGVTGQDSPVSPGLRDALLAMIAEKRFDHFQHTRRKADAKTIGLSARFGIPYATIESRIALVAAVEAQFREHRPQTSGVPLERWLALFRAERAPEIQDWPLLQDVPLLSWTAANTFRRHLSEDQNGLVEYLCQLYRSLRAAQAWGDRAQVTRWRIVHVLGASDAPAAIDVLAEAVGDQDESAWVRYGSARSLAEVASRAITREAADAVLARLKAAMPGLLGISAFEEIRDVALLAGPPPAWWAAEYGTVLETGISLLDGLTGSGMRMREQALQRQKTWRDQIARLQGVER